MFRRKRRLVRVNIEAKGSIDDGRFTRAKDNDATNLSDNLRDASVTTGRSTRRAKASLLKTSRNSIDDLRRHVDNLSDNRRTTNFCRAWDFRIVYLLGDDYFFSKFLFCVFREDNYLHLNQHFDDHTNKFLNLYRKARPFYQLLARVRRFDSFEIEINGRLTRLSIAGLYNNCPTNLHDDNTVQGNTVRRRDSRTTSRLFFYVSRTSVHHLRRHVRPNGNNRRNLCLWWDGHFLFRGPCQTFPAATRYLFRRKRRLLRVAVKAKGRVNDRSFTRAKDDDTANLGDDLRDASVTTCRSTRRTKASLLETGRYSINDLSRHVNDLGDNRRTTNFCRAWHFWRGAFSLSICRC